MFTKTELGYGKVRVTNTQSVRSKFTVGFIAGIIRYEIEQAAKKERQTATSIINDMNLLEMVNLNGTYAYVHEEKEIVLKVLKHLNAKRDLFEEVVKDENNRLNGIRPVPRHRKPGPKKKQAKKKKSKATGKKRGVPAGTKRSEINKNGTARKKPGVAVGTKRPEFNKDGSPRKKPGPKPQSSAAN